MGLWRRKVRRARWGLGRSTRRGRCEVSRSIRTRFCFRAVALMPPHLLPNSIKAPCRRKSTLPWSTTRSCPLCGSRGSPPHPPPLNLDSTQRP